MQKGNLLKWYMFLLATFIIWGTQHPPIKFLSGKISPFFFNFLRYSIATLVLLPFVLKNRFKIARNDLIKIFLLGFVGIFLYGVLDLIGVKLSTASNNAILLNSWPLFIVLIAPLLLNEKVAKKAVIGTLIGFIGIVLVVTQGAGISDLLNSEFFKGNLLIVFSGLCMAVYSMFGKKYIEKYGGLNVTFYAFASGSIMLFLFSLLSGEIFVPIRIDADSLLLLLWVAIPTTALTWVIWFKSIDLMGVIKTSSFFFLIPISGILSSALFLDEKITAYTGLGTLLIFSGIFLVQRKSD